MVEHALAYARAGLSVLPLAPGGKTPMTKHGKDGATTNLVVIENWWARNPLFNIGIRPKSGVVVLDIDPRNGGTTEALGSLPETWMAQTGGGGWHLWFRCAGKMRGRLEGAPGVDIKTNTGYLVAPPSIHPCGARYRWLNRAPIAELPDRLRDRVRAPVVSAFRQRLFGGDGTSAEGLVRSVAQAHPGQRNNILFWAAARVFAEGREHEVLNLIIEAAEAIGLSHNEIERTIRSASRRAA
ncbi:MULTISPECIES: bifunctional DNA primase/polymerase [unclassified Nocardia]|uniref:bifunctional DNA primase/polymerase n=1 Tax=unclassified Nocardia TaxID=2637762 RepID=UPI001CE3C5C6|nr:MULTISPECIES: bifunctional DNA primase/polymerase [unclassified Nocardia]